MYRINPDKSVEENIGGIVEYYHIEDHDGKVIISNFDPVEPIVQINLEKGTLITKCDIPNRDVKVIDLIVQFYVSELRYNQMATYEYLYNLMTKDLKKSLTELYSMTDYEKRSVIKDTIQDTITTINKISDYVKVTNDTLDIHIVQFSMDEIMINYGLDVYPTPIVLGAYARVKDVLDELYNWVKPKNIQYNHLKSGDKYSCTIFMEVGNNIVLSSDNVTYKICEHIINKIGGFAGTYNYEKSHIIWIEFNFDILTPFETTQTLNGTMISTVISNPVSKKRVHDTIRFLGGVVVNKNAQVTIGDDNGDITILPPTHVIYNHDRVIHSPVTTKVLYEKIKYVINTPIAILPPQKILIVSSVKTVLKDLLEHMGYKPVQISDTSPMTNSYDVVFIVSQNAKEVVKRIRKNYLYNVYIVIVKDPDSNIRVFSDTVVTRPFDKKSIEHVLEMARGRMVTRTSRRMSCIK